MGTPLWLVELIKKTFPNRKLIAKLTHLPVLGTIAEKLLFDGDDIMYLPKDNVITVNVNQSVDMPVETALPSKVVHDFIDKANFHWIMNKCICRDASQCEDYPIDLGCLFLGEAAKGINPALGRQVSNEEAHEHVRKCREAGLVHLIGRNKLDSVWLSVKPGEKLLTICNCCPCCCLWKMLPDVESRIGRQITKMPGISIHVTEDCIGCGSCAEGICFVDAITLRNGKAVISGECRACGRCVEVCPEDAIRIDVDDDLYVERSLERLAKVVDVE
jgi:ferredoxin